MATEHARATTFVAKERGKAKENRRTTAEVIEQVDVEFRILSWKAESVEREKDKKRHVEYHARHEAALLVLDRLKNKLKNAIAWLTSKEWR